VLPEQSIPNQAMSQLNYIVVSTPRSGTRYTARLLSACGLNCSHEGQFRFNKIWSEVGWGLENKSRTAPWGDSSWLAAPYLQHVPDDVIIIYQMRNPIDTIISITRQNLTTEPYIKPGQFAWETVNSMYPGALREDMEPLQVSMKFWSCWHRMIQDQLSDRPNVVKRHVENWSLLDVITLRGMVGIGSQAFEDSNDIRKAFRNTTENGREGQRKLLHIDRSCWMPYPELLEVMDLLYQYDVCGDIGE
jgi:hypothetical protein